MILYSLKSDEIKTNTGKNLRYPARIHPARACVKFLAAKALCTITWLNNFIDN